MNEEVVFKVGGQTMAEALRTWLNSGWQVKILTVNPQTDKWIAIVSKEGKTK
jgi:hypothetical protein